MSLSTRTEVDRLLAITVTAKHKILQLRVQAMTAQPDEHLRLHREIGALRSEFANADAQLQALQQGRVA